MEVPWRSISCRILQLQLKITLSCGQSFRWSETGENEWTSVLAGRVWRLRQDDERIFYKVFEPANIQRSTAENLSKALTVKTKEQKYSKAKTSRTNEKQCKVENANNDVNSTAAVKIETKRTPENNSSPNNYEVILRDYFQLDVDLEQLYKTWNKADCNFKDIACEFFGVRILRQDPVENLFSFICSSNNNISRITGMVQRLCENYGEFLMELEGVRYYGFPPVHALAAPQVEQQLRELGFGYRAKFINQSAQYIVKHHDQDWLFGLRDASYEEAHEALCKLPGVGAKVADCVCLMSLDKTQAIPVDTHVWQIAAKFYMPELNKTKTLTDKLYKQIGNHFRTLFGSYAGWAHSVLFSADLKKFQNLKSPKTTPVKKEKSKQKQSKSQPLQDKKKAAKRQAAFGREKEKKKKRKENLNV